MAEDIKILQRLQMPNGDLYEFDATQFGGKTVEEWQKEITGSVDYLGIATSLSALSTTAGKGDFYRIGNEGFTDAAAGKSVHAGDLVIANKDNPAQSLTEENWVIVHGEEGNLIDHKHGVTIPAKNVSVPSRTYTVSGSDTHKHTFTGKEATLSVSLDSSGTVGVSALKSSDSGFKAVNYTPEGSLSGSTAACSSNVNVSNKDHTHTVSISGDVTVGTGTATYTPAGSISQPTFSNGNAAANNSATESVAALDHTHKVTYTPKGNIEATFEGGSSTYSGTSGENSGTNTTVAVQGHTHSASYTPEGSVTSSFTGSEFTSTGSASSDTTNKADVAAQSHTHTASYTPAGSVAVTLSKSKANTDAIKVGTYDSSTKTLSFVAAAQSDFATGVSAQSFTGTQATINVAKTTATAVSASKSNHSHSVSVKGTATGTVASSFAGTAATISVGATSTTGFSAAPGKHTHGLSVSGTSAGSITGLKFVGTQETVTAVATETTGVSVSKATHTHSVTGTVSKPTFTGTGAHLKFAQEATAVASNAYTSVANASHTHALNSSAVFTGVGVQLTGSFSGGTNTASIKYTPEGTVENTTIQYATNLAISSEAITLNIPATTVDTTGAK